MNPHYPNALPSAHLHQIFAAAAPYDHERELQASLQQARLNCSYNRKHTDSVVQQARLMQQMMKHRFGNDLESEQEEDTLEQMFGRSIRRKKTQYSYFIKCLDFAYLVQLNCQQRQDILSLFQPYL